MTFPKIIYEQPPQIIYGQNWIYYNLFIQAELDLPSESWLMVLQLQEFVNIRKCQEQNNLLRRIDNTKNEDSSRSLLSLILLPYSSFYKKQKGFLLNL